MATAPGVGRPDGLLIDGRWVPPTDGARLAVVDPSTEETIRDVALAGPADAERAVEAARRAFDEGPWPRMRPAERGRVLGALGDLLDHHADLFATRCVEEAGSPCSSALYGQVLSGMPQYRDMVEWGSRGLDEALLPDESAGVAEVVVREPRGVVAALTPWNSPHVLQLHQLAPALVMGNTVVMKPSPATPSCALDVGQLALDAGIPPGVLNVVTGDAAVGQALATHQGVDMVSFIGSSATGKAIAQAAGATLKRLLLELGGKSALIVLPDADVDEVVALGDSITWYAGQGCGLLTRFIVPDSLHDRVVDGIAERLAAVRVGSAHDERTAMGPLISAVQRDRVEGYIDSALDEGARLVTGGGRPAGCERGWFVEPTLFTDVAPTMRIAEEEIFGPVLSVLRYDGDPDRAVDIANDSSYGLTGAVWTADRELGLRVARAVRTGRMHVNNWVYTERGPFGGYKSSGIGRTWGRFGVEEHSEIKLICWR